jgi:hypothetical protein
MDVKDGDVNIGDTVHVRRKVTGVAGAVGGKIANINIGSSAQPYWVPGEDIVHVEPRPLAVGDEVTYRGEGGYIIVGIDRQAFFLRTKTRWVIGYDSEVQRA